MHLTGVRRDGIIFKQRTTLEIKQFRWVELNSGTLLCKYTFAASTVGSDPLARGRTSGDPRDFMQSSAPHSYHQKCQEAQCGEALREVTEVSWDFENQPCHLSGGGFQNLPEACSFNLLPRNSRSKSSLKRCSHTAVQRSILCSLLPLPSHFSLRALRSREKGDTWYSYTGASLHLVQLMLHWIWTRLWGHHCCRRVYLLDSRVGLSWPLVFAPVTLLSKSTPGSMRTFTVMLFVCISVSNYSLQYGHFWTSDILLPFCLPFPQFSLQLKHPSVHHDSTIDKGLPFTAPIHTLMPTIGSGRIKQQSFPWLFPKLNALTPH